MPRFRDRSPALAVRSRPDYRSPVGRVAQAKGEQGTLEIGQATTAAKAARPKALPEQIAAVRAAFGELG
ncbi:MAG: hypothetical protein MUF63_07400 [Rhodobacteraceae bacterium]|nr:hypothetical protein [Paracoccaceae bacterium]